jgi:disulfide bond formation protein DsbB
VPEAKNRSDPEWAILFVCWLLVSAATLGSLFFSEVMELPPCSLCWVQWVFMFPLTIVLLVGLFPFDPRVVHYALPLAEIGGAFAFYRLPARHDPRAARLGRDASLPSESPGKPIDWKEQASLLGFERAPVS